MNARNRHLWVARVKKNDEFYTKLSDIEAELKYYNPYFSGKIVYLNCDNPEQSNFWKYFEMNFDSLGLKKLISTHYTNEANPYKLEMWGKNRYKKSMLVGNGDFRSEECVEILKECDVVVTNPPFSLFREYIKQLVEYDKKFLIIGNYTCITHKEIFPFIKANKIWFGINYGTFWFYVPDSCEGKNIFVDNHGTKKQQIRNIIWFTNINNNKRHYDLVKRLNKLYSSEEYPKFDNYNAINVDKVSDIPKDYFGVIGVPITFLTKYNPEQFSIISFRKGDDGRDLVITHNGEKRYPYNRILVQRITR